MKRHSSGLVIAVLVLGVLCSHPNLIQPAQARESKAPAEPVITVLSPMGQPPAIQQLAMAPRLDTLAGKTVYVVDDGYVGGDVLLKEIVAWFGRNMPEVNAVYKRKAGSFTDDDPVLWAEIKEQGDAMIMGMGH